MTDENKLQARYCNGSLPCNDNHNASFGYVLAGMDVVDKIATCPVDDKNSQSPAPLTPVVIESITFVQPK